MEFLLYLTRDAHQIMAMVRRAGYQTKENYGFCRKSDLFGYAEPGHLIICTKNIRHSGYDPHQYVPETLLHEAVHVAQLCRGGAFGISKGSMPLPLSKLQDVRNSVAASSATAQVEHEAYWMENKPNEVKYVLKKFCF